MAGSAGSQSGRSTLGANNAIRLPMPLAALDDPGEPEPQRAEALNEPDIVIGSREQIFHLLAEASEIEHTLMCSYLYAAFSLKSGTTSGLSDTELKAVERWRQNVMTVAIEEMGHLMIVANLTAALGGRPHFSRPNFPVSPGYFPSGVVLRLTPFSVETLDHFIFLERPTGVESQDGDGFSGVGPTREQAHQGLMPSAQDYITVSHLYEAIRANLRAFVERSGAASLFVGSESAQLGPEIITMLGVETIRDLQTASHAIDLIVEQGEGSPADCDDSHYRRFQATKTQYKAFLTENPDFAPAYPVAENPVMRRPAAPEGKIFIDAEPAAMILDLANSVYGMLLRFLVQAYAKSSTTAAPEKERMLGAAIDLMHVLNETCKILARLPASLDHPNINAGMTFTMLRGVEPFIEGAAERILILERLHQLTCGAERAASAVPEVAGAAQMLRTLVARFQAQS